MAADKTSFEDLGPNSGLIEEMYRRYVENPGSVAETWRDFFADYKPLGATDGNGSTGEPRTAASRPRLPHRPRLRRPRPPAPRHRCPGRRIPGHGRIAHARWRRRRHRRRRRTADRSGGAAARTVVNMEASLGVPDGDVGPHRSRPACSRSTARYSTTSSPAAAAPRSASPTSSRSPSCARSSGCRR